MKVTQIVSPSGANAVLGTDLLSAALRSATATGKFTDKAHHKVKLGSAKLTLTRM